MKKLCALIIGHKQKSPGAINKEMQLKEFEFNEDLACRIQKFSERVNIIRIYRRTYNTLPDDVNELKPNFAISLHCNSFEVNKEVSGSEVFYHHRSQKSKILAEILLNHFLEELEFPSRGIQPVTAEGKNGYLLRYTKCPVVVATPFFIDNYTDLTKVLEDPVGLAMAYVRAIEEFSVIVDELSEVIDGFSHL